MKYCGYQVICIGLAGSALALKSVLAYREGQVSRLLLDSSSGKPLTYSSCSTFFVVVVFVWHWMKVACFAEQKAVHQLGNLIAEHCSTRIMFLLFVLLIFYGYWFKFAA